MSKHPQPSLGSARAANLLPRTSRSRRRRNATGRIPPPTGEARVVARSSSSMTTNPPHPTMKFARPLTLTRLPPTLAARRRRRLLLPRRSHQPVRTCNPSLSAPARTTLPGLPHASCYYNPLISVVTCSRVGEKGAHKPRGSFVATMQEVTPSSATPRPPPDHAKSSQSKGKWQPPLLRRKSLWKLMITLNIVIPSQK